MTESNSKKSEQGRELVSFRVGEQEFCVDIQCVREIRGWTTETVLPHAPDYVRGVINLRGAVLPIVDLGARLGFGSCDPTARHVIIFTQVGTQITGLLVDAVSDILTVAEGDIQTTPDVASEMAKTFVRGVLPAEGRMLSLIDIEDALPVDIVEAA